MAMDPEDRLLETIKKTLTANGFPEKKVSLPIAKLQAASDKLGLDLEMALTRLSYADIYYNISGDKITFADDEIEELASPFSASGEGQPSGSPLDGLAGMFGDIDPSDFKGLGKMGMMKKAAEMMKNMSPEQMESIQNMYQNMSPEEQKDIMSKAKDMDV